MQFFIHAVNSGKLVRVQDRIAGQEVFNGFIDADATVPVDVASNDGATGDIDLRKRLTAENPWTLELSDYAVKAGETIEVDD